MATASAEGVCAFGATDVFLRSYHVKHRICMKEHLCNAMKVANHAVLNKNNKKLLTSKHVKQFNLPSAISNQILRKYGRGTIKEAKNVNLIVPNQTTTIKNKKTNEIKKYNSIIWSDGVITIIPLKLSFRWNPGRTFEKINQIEIDKESEIWRFSAMIAAFMISVTYKF